MTDARDPQPAVDAAEQAAAAGDYASAEQLLREAVRLQEASLGPLHPDLANTLNNLGVVCEITNKPDDAEHFFRRAYGIATEVLEPDHPFVATSRKNLEDFCTARGRPVDVPSEAPTAEPESVAASGVADFPPERPQYQETRPPVESAPTRRFTPVALAVALLLVALAIVLWFRSSSQVESAAESPEVPTSGPPAAAPQRPVKPVTQDVPPEVPAKPVRSTGEAKELAAPPSSRSESVVADVQLCKELATRSSEWRCAPPDQPAAPGVLFFYTRVKSPTVTRVQHRWFRGDRLRQTVNLTVRANPTAGYRTYSRQTVDGQGTGDWRVELRSSDGSLLHEERFTVR
jgi:hypothetical protein